MGNGDRLRGGEGLMGGNGGRVKEWEWGNN